VLPQIVHPGIVQMPGWNPARRDAGARQGAQQFGTGRGPAEFMIVKRRTSLLKKRSKKLLDFCRAPVRQRTPNDKSFLVLFFKKELLPVFP
jgi:hypothetical protein